MVAPVINMPSNKHSGVSGRDTQLFVQHSAESPLRGGYAQSLTNWARTPLNQGGPEASWPSFVDPIARVRMIAWPNSAWTQGLANQIGVGLECAGYARFSAAEWLTPEGLKQLENLAHEWCYYLDLEAKAGNIIPLRWLTTSEVQKVMAGNRTIKGFCTHAQIDPGSRTDPGKGFPYTRLMNRIKEIRGGKTVTAASTTTKDWFDMADAKDLDAALDRFAKRHDLEYGGWNYHRKNDKQDASSHLVNPGPNLAKYKVRAADGKPYRLDTFWRNTNRDAQEAAKNTRAIIAQNEALTAAVAALAGSKGIDVKPIIEAINGAAERATARLDQAVQDMKDIELTVVVNDSGDITEEAK